MTPVAAAPRATVLVPTHDHASLLGHAVGSALAQTVGQLEVVVVGDGVGDDTREVVAALAADDERVRFVDNPKGPRHGEVHRHAALAQARAPVVCYLSDDDLWMPDHVEVMLGLLEDADFASAPPARFSDAQHVEVLPADLAMPFYRELLLAGTNRVPLSCAAHTLAMYQRLPEGWRPAPESTPTDLHMWQQFLADPTCRAASSTTPTVLNFPEATRTDWEPARRIQELERWSARIGDAREREHLLAALLGGMLVPTQIGEIPRLRATLEAQRREVDSLHAQLDQSREPLERIRTLEGELARERERAGADRARSAELRALEGSRGYRALRLAQRAKRRLIGAVGRSGA